VIPHSRPTIEADDLAAVGRTLASGHLAQGPEVQAFEEEMAAFLGLRGGVATSSGTAALHLALVTLGVGPGTDVLIPTYTCVALLHAVHLVGAEARLVDCASESVNMGVHEARQQLSPATRAVVLPHMLGAVAAVGEFRRLGVPIIENCAQALGATDHGRPVGAAGDIAVVSFYATKMITTGEGGMLLSSQEGLLEAARDLRDYDKREDDRLRFNYKMTDVQASLGRTQLRKLTRFLERRRAIAKQYDDALRCLGPAYAPIGPGDAPYRYVRAVPTLGPVVRDLAAEGVECTAPVFRPLHELVRTPGYPHATRVHRHAMSLPLYPSLSDDEAATVARRVQQAIERQMAAANL